MTHCCCFFLLYNTTIEEDDNTLPSSSCSQTQRRQNTQKNNKKKGGNLFSSFHSALSLLAPTFALLFQTLSPSTFFFSSKRKEKKCREGKELSFKLLLYPFTLCSCFCPLASTCLFQTLSHGIFFFLNRLKKNKEKKTIEKKKCREGKEFTFKLSFSPFTFGSCFYPLVFAFLLQTPSPLHFFSQAEGKNTIKKKTNVEKGGSLTFFSCFCIWDEALLLLSPLHIPSMLSTPPSSSLVSHISSKLCATQARNSPKLWRWNEWEMK